MTRVHRSVADCPGIIPLFPLRGTMLLPRGHLPLSIFEPRYLSLVDDVLGARRVIGIIQPDIDGVEDEQSASAPLYKVGSVGRITQFVELEDGRYLIALTGIARFRIVEELPVLTSYRQALVEYEPFQADFTARAGEEEVDRPLVLNALRRFAAAKRLRVDWEAIERASNEALVNALAMMSPFGPREKQALLEAVDLKARAEMLVAITEIELAHKDVEAELILQ